MSGEERRRISCESGQIQALEYWNPRKMQTSLQRDPEHQNNSWKREIRNVFENEGINPYFEAN